jgi:hypothetical protein
VLSCFSSRRNWDSPNPSPAGECAPPPPVLGGGAHWLAREGLGESQFRRGDIHCGIYTYFVVCEIIIDDIFVILLYMFSDSRCSRIQRVDHVQSGVKNPERHPAGGCGIIVAVRIYMLLYNVQVLPNTYSEVMLLVRRTLVSCNKPHFLYQRSLLPCKESLKICVK